MAFKYCHDDILREEYLPDFFLYAATIPTLICVKSRVVLQGDSTLQAKLVTRKILKNNSNFRYILQVYLATSA